jgi:crotonobetainyl-CoA:carnitine CoA-transferase CaiB-like acyl-CoA transferase
MTAPMEGIRVIEVANYVAAPAAGALMRDLGADVIKVEPPGGEVMRGLIAPPAPNYLFELENRGKQSVVIALDRPGGPELVHRLLDSADVLLTNLIRPRLEKYGLMPAQVLERHPRIVHVSVTGYGLSGPDAARPGFDFAAFWARSGLMGLVGHPDTPPVLSRVAQGDHTTGMNTLAATLAALRMRDLTGRGQAVEVTLQRTGVYTAATDIARTLVDGKQPNRFDRTNVPNPLFNTYCTSDGQWLMVVHMTPDPYWPKLCAALGLTEFAADGRFRTMAGRMRESAMLCAAIDRRFREEPYVHWAERLDAHGLIWAPMVELPEVVQDAQLRHQEAFQRIEDHAQGPFETVAVPFRIAGADIRVRGASSSAGADTAAVLARAGLSEDEVADLAASGVLG